MSLSDRGKEPYGKEKLAGDRRYTAAGGGAAGGDGAPAGEKAEEDTVVIRVGNEEYARVPLSEPQTLTIKQENGAVNVVEVTENGMRMVSSTCQNQICVHRGWITLDNWELMGGAFISCLPNQVLLELLEAEAP